MKPPPVTRTTLHVDMDAFFAAIEQRDRPELRGKPVVVGSPPDQRGVVSTCSYEARVFGIHSAMPSRTAGKLCPQATFVPVRMAHYAEVSSQVMEIFESFTPVIQQVSVDEAFLDIRGALRIWSDPVALARDLKQRISDRLSLTASVGVATNKYLAKLASDMDKPDGLTVVPETPGAICAFLADLPVERIWGVGKATARRVREAGYRTNGDLQQVEEPLLRTQFGNALGAHLWRLSRGIDSRTVETERIAKSISNEHTFGVDCGDPDTLRQQLVEMTEHVGWRVRKAGKRARTGQLKIRFDDFSTFTRRLTLPAPTSTDRKFLACALQLFDQVEVVRPVRLIGFGVSNFDEEEGSRQTQQELNFDPGSIFPSEGKEEQLDQAVDRIRDAFGKGAVSRGNWRRKRQP